MSMYAAFKTDAKKEAEGVVVDFGKFRVTIRRAGGANKLYQKTMERIVAPYQRILQLRQMPEGRMNELLAEGYAEAIVANWEYQVEEPGDGLSEPTTVWKAGLELPTGGIGEVNPVNVKAVLLAVPEIFGTIQEVASAVKNYTTDNDTAAMGN